MKFNCLKRRKGNKKFLLVLQFQGSLTETKKLKLRNCRKKEHLVVKLLEVCSYLESWEDRVKTVLHKGKTILSSIILPISLFY